MIGQEQSTLFNGISALIKEIEGSGLALSSLSAIQEVPFMSEPFPDTESSGTLILDVIGSRMVRSTFLLFTNYPV